MSKKNNKKKANKSKKKPAPIKNTNKRGKSVKSRNKKLKKKAKDILSDKRWKASRDASGKIVKGRRKSKKLSRAQDQNRYQSIIKTLSEYYKKAGSPLKRGDLYKKYREIRDEFSNVPISVLIPNFEKIVIKKQATRTFPAPLILGIDWFNFEDVMTSPFSQAFFRSNDTIVLDLSCIGMSNMTFPYSKVIGQYNRLYNNYVFRTAVKQQKSPPPQFVYNSGKSNPNKGIYVFELEDCPPPVAGSRTAPSTPSTIGKVIEDAGILSKGPLADMLDVDTLKEQRRNKVQEEINELQKQKTQSKTLYAKDKLTKLEYQQEMTDIEDAISEKQRELRNI